MVYSIKLYKVPFPPVYSCKAKDEEGENLLCTCTKLTEKGKYNCACFIDNPPNSKVYYLDCLDAFKKGQNKSSVYAIKRDNMSPFKVWWF